MRNDSPHAKAVQDALDLATERGLQFANRSAENHWWGCVAHSIQQADAARRQGRMTDYDKFVSLLVAYTLSDYGSVVESVLKPYQVRLDRLERRGA